MPDPTIVLLLGAAVAGYGAFYFLFSRYRWNKVDLPGMVRREVEKRDGTLISIERTGLFDTGPFPKVETSGPTRERPIISSTAIPLGDRCFYRKVVWDDRNRSRRTSWIKLDFIPFYRLHEVAWKDEG